MKTSIYCITWNEEYLLPYFLNHYSWADEIHIIDNGSTDKTLDIASKHPKVILEHYETGNQQNNEVMRQVKNICWKGSDADWVVVCDVDEWLVGHEILKNYYGNIVFKPVGWQMVGEGEPIYEIKRGYRDENFDKMVCFSPKIDEINFNHGCHRANPIGGEIINAMKLLHYNYLSEEYVVNRWKRYVPRMCQQDLEHQWGVQYLMSPDEIGLQYRNALKSAIPILI